MINWVIHICILSVAAFIAFKYIQTDLPAWVFWSSLILKLLAGLALGLIFYEYYGSGDTISFFQKAENLALAEKQPRTNFFLLILRPIVLLTHKSYWITSLYFSFFSFLGFWYSTQIISRLYPNIKWLIAGSFLFIPSIIFWSSGIIKDSISSASLMILVALSLKFYQKNKPKIIEVALLLIAAWILLNIKHYVMIAYIIFTGSLLTSFISAKLDKQWKILSLLILLTAVFATQYVHPYLKINRISQTLYENNKAILSKTDSNPLNIQLSKDSWAEIISNSPAALHAGLFRPSIFDQTPLWGIVHKIENLLLATLIFMSLLMVIKRRPLVDWPLLAASLTAILMLAILLPLSTPNYGTLVRYKNAYMPYLFLIASISPFRYLTSQTEE